MTRGFLLLLLALLLNLSACSSTPSTFDNVLITADDGTVLRGRLYGRGVTAVVLVHDFGSDQKVWESLGNALAERGFMVLTYDMRGQGDSPGSKEVGLAAADAAAAVRYLNRSAQRRQVELVGVGLGGTAVLKTAAQEQVLGVAVLSAYSEFHGLSAASDITRITAAKLFVAGQGDDGAVATAQGFNTVARQPSEFLQVPGSLRGKSLKGGVPQEAREATVNFLTKNKGN